MRVSTSGYRDSLTLLETSGLDACVPRRRPGTLLSRAFIVPVANVNDS